MMMKILYGVQGTGNGHITRARVMAEAFAARDNVQVDFLFSGREPSGYFDMDCFGNYQTRQGMTFVTRNGQVDRWKTCQQARLGKLAKDARQLAIGEYDLVINDFEPVTAWAAMTHHVPSISISHQAAFLHKVPKTKMTLSDKLLTRYFAPTNYQLGVHWYHFGQPIVPPFIQQQAASTRPGGFVLVYLPFEEPAAIERLLKPFNHIQFESFHPGAAQHGDSENLRWHRPSKLAFQQQLSLCDGVIANAGFELSSECLQLGKKLLLKPLAGQFEQYSNVLTLQKLGLCEAMTKLDSGAVERWLMHPRGRPVRFPADPTPLVDWLLSEQWHDSHEVVEKLWSQVEFPRFVQGRLSGLRRHQRALFGL